MSEGGPRYPGADSVIADLIGLLGLALLAILHAGDAAGQPVLGYVAAKNANQKRLAVFKQGLPQLGYAEGRNVRIEYREAVLDVRISRL